MTTIDTCGRSCPEPVLMVLECLRNEKPEAVDVLVDNEASRENVSRAASNNGYNVTIQEEGPVVRLSLQRS